MSPNNLDNLDPLLASIKVPLDHPSFYPRLFTVMARRQQKQQKKGPDSLEFIATDEYEELSRYLDRSNIQESVSVRNILRTRKLAQRLIDSKGELQVHELPPLIAYLEQNLYSLGPERQYDAKRQRHLLKVLQLLQNTPSLARLLKQVSAPFMNKWAEELIQQTLQLPAGTSITDSHARQAVLAAWLSYLRQNVGSCFATAPAEIIHDEQPEQFLQDLIELLSTGRLKRTFGGIEYTVPLSASWGNGDLKKPLLLRLSTTGISPQIWDSPGLIRAFEAVGFLQPNDLDQEKTKQIERWIAPLIQQKSTPWNSCILTADEIIRTVLLHLLGLSEQQLHDYQSRPRDRIQTQFPPSPASKKYGGMGMGERCAHFLQAFEVAKNAFKALADHALLKAWEFTLASFSETKLDFTRWNLYASLGLSAEEAGGIGQCISQIIQHKLDQANRQAEEIQYEYEGMYTQVKTLETRMRQASTEQELQWLRIDYQGRANELYFLQEQRNAAQERAQGLVHLYDALYKLYVELFKDYFQEVYDADIQEITTGPFDDSPAGFTLLYKHGRSQTSQWTPLRNQYDFIEALNSFFVTTESHILHLLENKERERDLADVITAIIHHIKTPEFLESAFHRMARAHHAPLIKNPLENLSQIEKKPWSYTSGGTMETLVSCYYRLESQPKKGEKWVESEMELLVYLADTLKQIPPALMDPYLKGKRHSLLMQSPTHAFLLKPLGDPFKETWMHEEFTYTFIRDHFIRPAEIFVEQLLLSEEMQAFLIHQLTEKVPENFQPRFKSLSRSLQGPLTSIFFRDYLVNRLKNDRGLYSPAQQILPADEIDRFLFSALPLTPLYEFNDRLKLLLLSLPGMGTEKREAILKLADRLPRSRGNFFLTARQFQEMVKALFLLNEGKSTFPDDYHWHLSLQAQKLGFAMPPPLIFADTNWVKEEFGFVVNPGTGKLELWRLDSIGSQGSPMSSWKQWVDGSRPDLKWGIYVKPAEYGQA